MTRWPATNGETRAAHPQLVAAQDDLVAAEAVHALELERHRPGRGDRSRCRVGGRRRRGGVGVGSWAAAEAENVSGNRLPMTMAATRRIERGIVHAHAAISRRLARHITRRE